MKIAAVIGAVLAAAAVTVSPAAATRVAAPASPPIDVEVAVDTTGSMDVSIKNAKASATTLVAGLLGLDANARLAVVSFRDPGNPGGEYQVLQPMTADAGALADAINQLHTVHNSAPGNVAQESYNLAFHNSYADRSIGWRDGSRKLVIVIGDAEPYGAGKAGLTGCGSQLADPDGFTTAKELAAMAKSGRTLLMVREIGPATSASLACFRSMADRTYAHGIAIDDSAATGDISAAVLTVVQNSLAPVAALVTPIFARTHGALRAAIRVRNPNPFPVTLQRLTVTPSRGFGSSPSPGWTAGAAGTLTASPNVVVPAGKTYAASIGLIGPASRADVAGSVTTSVMLPDGDVIAPSAGIRATVGRSFALHISEQTGATVGTLTLAGTRAGGLLRLRSSGRSWTITPTRVQVVQQGTRASVTVSGTWRRSATCAAAPARLRLTLTAAFTSSSGYSGSVAFRPPCSSRSLALATTTTVTAR